MVCFLVLETREPAEFQLSESPDICTDQQEMPYLDDSPMSTPRAIVIDKSFHLSPRQQGKYYLVFRGSVKEKYLMIILRYFFPVSL